METLRKPLKDHVYDYISSRIDAGELSAGDRLSEQAICDAMGVSRTPVREALIQLASDGYLDNLPRRGFRVRGFDQQNAVEVFEIMGPLDGPSASNSISPTLYFSFKVSLTCSILLTSNRLGYINLPS